MIITDHHANSARQVSRLVCALVVLPLLAAQLGGCASALVGYDAETEHTSCPATEGVTCTPVSDVYRRAMAGTLPGQLRANAQLQIPPVVVAQAPTTASSTVIPNATSRPTMSSGAPVRTAPRVLRIWFAPWTDDLEVLHDQRHSYLTLDSGRWLIEHNQRRLMQQFAATRLVQGGDSATPAASAKPAATAQGRSTVMPMPAILSPSAPGER
jgi:conjugal transfer pilus assembly protein TraV